MKKKFSNISKISALVVIFMSMAPTLAYAASAESSKASALVGIDPNIMAMMMAPFALAFLAITILHAAKMLGWKPALRMVGISLVIVYVLEEIGVHSGIIFGRYYFTCLWAPNWT